MTDRERALDGAVGRRRATVRVRGVEETGPFPGRHASRTEIAAETPIFHALTVGGWRSRQSEPTTRQAPPRRRRSADPLDEFHRDPLTAPIPVQAYSALIPAPAERGPAEAAPRPSDPVPAPLPAGGSARVPLYAAHVPAYVPAAPAYTSLTDTGPQALLGLGGRHHRRAVGSGSGHHHLPY